MFLSNPAHLSHVNRDSVMTRNKGESSVSKTSGLNDPEFVFVAEKFAADRTRQARLSVTSAMRRKLRRRCKYNNNTQLTNTPHNSRRLVSIQFYSSKMDF